MTLLASDTYTPDGVTLAAHIPLGVNVLSYDYTDVDDYHIASGGILNTFNRPNYCRANIGTVSMGSVSVWADVYRTAVDGFSQGCSFGIACDSANAVFDQSGIYLEIRRSDAAQMIPVIALVDATGTITREVSDLTRIDMATFPSGEGRRLVLERQGAVVNMYESDYLTGANPVFLLTLTLTGPESAFYDDGNHLDCGLQVTGSPTSAVVVINAFELNTLADPSCATLFRDDFIDPDNTQLDVHTPAPLASPGTIWEYITAGAAPYAINSNAVNDDGTGLANPARASQIILDDLIESGGVFNAGGPVTQAQTGQLHICMEETPIEVQPGRITAEVNGAGLAFFMVRDDGSFRTGATASLGGRDLYLPFEMGVTKAGTRIEQWVQDVGGGNRVSNLETLTPTEQALYEDGAHRMVGISCTGTQAGHFVCEYLQVDNFCPVQPSGSTLPALASGVPVFGAQTEVTPTGDALQTLASDVAIFQFNVTPIGSSFGQIVTGLPTFTGQNQAPAAPSRPVADIELLASPPQKYNQLDESQTRRILERNIQRTFTKLDDLVSGTAMFWGGEWTEGTLYPKYTVVTVDGWLMIANKDTVEDPEPQLVGPPEQGVPSDPTWVLDSDPGHVATGQRYTFAESGLLTQVRVWIPDIANADLEYGVLINNIGTDTIIAGFGPIDISPLSAPGWLEFNLSKALVPLGAVLSVALVTENHADDSTQSFQYVYDGNVPDDPPSGDWNREGNAMVRLSILDDGGTDQSFALGLIAAGTELFFTDAAASNRTRSYSVVTNLGLNAQATAYEYEVQLLDSQSIIPVGALCDVDIIAYGVAPAPYVGEAIYWTPGVFPSWASDAQGVLAVVPGQPGVVSDTVYGADFTFQQVEFPADWDFMAYTDLGTVALSGSQFDEEAKGMVQASGSGASIAFAFVDTDVAFVTAATVTEKTKDWTVVSSDSLEFFSFGNRLISISLNMVWNTGPAGQIFRLGLVLDGVLVETRTVPMPANKPMALSMTLQALVELGDHTLDLVVRNVTSTATLDVDEISIMITDSLAQQSP